MGKWNNAHYLLSDEIVGFAHNVLADYQSCDFETFRSRLLELVNGQSEMKNILNDVSPYFQEMRDGVFELKEMLVQLLASYQEEKESSVTLSQDVVEQLAEAVIQRLDESVKENSLEGILTRIREMTEKKVAPQPETPNYGPKINQLLTAVNSLHQQNRELMNKLEELDNSQEQGAENDSFQMQEDNKSLLQALNKYKAAYITLKNERNDLSMQVEKLKKENFLRIRRKELQDALLEQKEQEIARLKEELAAHRESTARPDSFTGISISRPENGAGAHTVRGIAGTGMGAGAENNAGIRAVQGMTGAEIVSRARAAAATTGAAGAVQAADLKTKESADRISENTENTEKSAVSQLSGRSGAGTRDTASAASAGKSADKTPVRSGKKSADAKAGTGRGNSLHVGDKTGDSAAESSGKSGGGGKSSESGRVESVRPAGKGKGSRASSKTAGSASSSREGNGKQTGSSGIERAKKR